MTSDETAAEATMTNDQTVPEGSVTYDLNCGDSPLLISAPHVGTLLPDEIAIFRGPINRTTRSRQEAVEEVRETVIHELGHYFGLSDDEMES